MRCAQNCLYKLHFWLVQVSARFCAQTMESMGVVYAIVRKDGKALSVTSLNMTVKSLTVLDMDSALPVYASVSPAGKAQSVSKVSVNTC